MEENQEVKPVNKDDRTWAMLCHLSALAGFVVPFGSIIGPLIVWLIKKDEMPIVDEHGKKALNFQITMAIAYLVCFLLIAGCSVTRCFLLILSASYNTCRHRSLQVVFAPRMRSLDGA